MISQSEYYKRTLAHIRRVQDNIGIFIKWIEEGLYEDLIDEVTEGFQGRLRIFDLINRATYHDLTKFWEQEMVGYRTAIQEDGSFKSELLGDAWTHHKDNNDHHLEFWTQAGMPLDMMPKAALIELICDWEAIQFQEHGSSMLKTQEKVSYYGGKHGLSESTQRGIVGLIWLLRMNDVNAPLSEIKK